MTRRGQGSPATDEPWTRGMTAKALTVRGLKSRRLFPLLVAGLAILAYQNSFQGVLMFDDSRGVLAGAGLDRFPDCMLHSTRPVMGFSIYLHYLTGFTTPADFHAVNLAIHVCAALALYGICRRTLQLPLSAGRVRSPGLFAFAVASLWAVHPLQTESVTYVVQRSESLMGFFYLATLSCCVRAMRSRRASRWHTTAVVCCALGMATKPVMVTAPFLVFLHDRFFIGGSFREALRRRWRIYVALCATLVLPLIFLSMPNESSATIGSNVMGITALGYLFTQFGVLMRYLRLSLWPTGLCLDYGWPMARGVREILVPGAILSVLGLATLWATVRRRPMGYAGLWYFMTLAPTSSIMPVVDYAFEHRMYLPLAGIVVVAVSVARGALNRFLPGDGAARRRRILVGGCLLAAALVVLVLGTRCRNTDYHTREGMARDVVGKRPGNMRWRGLLVNALLAEGRFADAERAAREMVVEVDRLRRRPDGRFVTANDPERLYPVAHNHLGRALLCLGRNEAALRHFETAIRARPGYPVGHSNLALALLLEGRLQDAETACKNAIRVDARHARPHQLLAAVYARQGRDGEAVASYRRCLDLEPGSVPARAELAWLLSTSPDEAVRDGTEALALASAVVQDTAACSHRALEVLAAAHAELGDFDRATRAAAKAVYIAVQRGGPEGLFPAVQGDDGTAHVAGASTDLVPGMRARLDLYREGKPYRESATDR